MPNRQIQWNARVVRHILGVHHREIGEHVRLTLCHGRITDIETDLVPSVAESRDCTATIDLDWVGAHTGQGVRVWLCLSNVVSSKPLAWMDIAIHMVHVGNSFAGIQTKFAPPPCSCVPLLAPRVVTEQCLWHIVVWKVDAVDWGSSHLAQLSLGNCLTPRKPFLDHLVGIGLLCHTRLPMPPDQGPVLQLLRHPRYQHGPRTPAVAAQCQMHPGKVYPTAPWYCLATVDGAEDSAVVARLLVSVWCEVLPKHPSVIPWHLQAIIGFVPVASLGKLILLCSAVRGHVCTQEGLSLPSTRVYWAVKTPLPKSTRISLHPRLLRFHSSEEGECAVNTVEIRALWGLSRATTGPRQITGLQIETGGPLFLDIDSALASSTSCVFELYAVEGYTPARTYRRLGVTEASYRKLQDPSGNVFLNFHNVGSLLATLNTKPLCTIVRFQSITHWVHVNLSVIELVPTQFAVPEVELYIRCGLAVIRSSRREGSRAPRWFEIISVPVTVNAELEVGFVCNGFLLASLELFIPLIETVKVLNKFSESGQGAYQPTRGQEKDLQTKSGDKLGTAVLSTDLFDHAHAAFFSPTTFSIRPKVVRRVIVCYLRGTCIAVLPAWFSERFNSVIHVRCGPYSVALQGFRHTSQQQQLHPSTVVAFPCFVPKDMQKLLSPLLTIDVVVEGSMLLGSWERRVCEIPKGTLDVAAIRPAQWGKVGTPDPLVPEEYLYESPRNTQQSSESSECAVPWEKIFLSRGVVNLLNHSIVSTRSGVSEVAAFFV